MSTFPATALPSQPLSLTDVWTKTLASRGRTQSPGPSPQESQPAEQGRYRAVSQRAEWGCVHPIRRNLNPSPHADQRPHPASLPNNRDQESTLWHLLLRTISLLVVLGVEMRRGMPWGRGKDSCQAGLSCDGYSGQAGWVREQWALWM